jgi:pimeloyl-ACP methyl ester carboxylesterase
MVDPSPSTTPAPSADASGATVVLVHGNPETPAVWRDLVPRLGSRAVRLLQLPGFGGAAPPDFGATLADYLTWLVGRLERLRDETGRPVDLVGHDLGGIFTVCVACERPDLVQTWASDVLGLFDAGYVWHDMAQLWQTPEVGEQTVAALTDLPVADRRGLLLGAGIPEQVAADIAAAVDSEMNRCILALYRSMTQPAMADYAAAHLADAASRPGLCLAPSGDLFTGGVDLARRAATVAGAEVAVLDGLGHWWMVEDPDAGAAALLRFWATSSR